MASSRKAFEVTLNDETGFQRLLPGVPETHGMKSGRVYLEAGKSCGQHSTKDNEELLVFLTGEGKVHIGDSEQLAVGAGKIAYIPPRTLHDVENTGSGPLAYIYCVAPARID
ncbi:MAG: cupin domain-containing protein [Phycisphaerales bacterium]|nr:MAG: cupin domain-containing protein [Phycisphaerales bacterium]